MKNKKVFIEIHGNNLEKTKEINESLVKILRDFISDYEIATAIIIDSPEKIVQCGRETTKLSANFIKIMGAKNPVSKIAKTLSSIGIIISDYVIIPIYTKIYSL